MNRVLVIGAALAVAGCYAPEQAAAPLPDFVVSFHGGAFTLDATAAQLVAAAAAVANAAPGRRVDVEGYADRPETPQANQILSRLRAQAVAEALVRLGVEKAQVHVRPKTAYGGDPGIESRRVEIVIGR